MTEEAYTVVDIEKIKGKAEHFKGEVEQALGRVAGSMETQARGKVDEAKGTVTENFAQFKGAVGKEASEAREKFVELKDKAHTSTTRLNPTSIAIVIVGVVIALALVRGLAHSRRAAHMGGEG